MMSSYHCSYCKEDILSDNLINHSKGIRHELLCSEKDCYIVDSAFKCRIISYRINCTEDVLDPKICLLKIGEKLEKLINIELDIHKLIKVNVVLFCTFLKTDSEGEVTRDVKSFNTKNVSLHTTAVDFPEYFSNIISTISKKCEEFQERDSGWALEKVEFVDININKYQPLKGSKYIPLPKSVQAKKACVNVKNKDDACFLWAITSALHPVKKNSDRVTSYPHYADIFNLQGIQYPVSYLDIKQFEKLNKISVNVYGIDSYKKNHNKGKIKDFSIEVLRISKITGTRHVDLLYYERGNVSHYCWIKNLSNLVRSQITKHKAKAYICKSCLQHFHNEKKLTLHQVNGCEHKRIELPEENNKFVKFKNVSHKIKVPFVIYADFESIQAPIRRNEKTASTSTYNTHKHVPCCYAYYIHCDYDENLSKFRIYRGEDCVEKFVQSIIQDAEEIAKILETVVPPKRGDDDSSSSNICHICKNIIQDDQCSVEDHCHLTGEIRGKTHQSCNLQFQLPKFIPVIFHNLSGYDSHLFIKELAKIKGNLNCIPHNKEKYISFSKNLGIGKTSLKFIDSYKFMPHSLERLVQNLSREQFKILPKFLTSPSTSLYQHQHHVEQEKLMELLNRKGVFPYDYVSEWDKLEETSLPTQDTFFNKLTDIQISNEDYQHAELVWRTFNIRSLGEYCDLYLKTDVLLLAEVFENFRQICMNTYELDPCQYVTAPGLSWDAMLKYTGVNLELFTDYEMIQFIKKGIRGGISQASKRHAKANNRFMEDYDPKQESSFIVYLDINNLYGDAMRRKLPISNFRWMKEDEIKNFDPTTQQADSNFGYILEVDLEYPHKLHDSHNDYPLCAETKKPPGGKNEKLLLTFDSKTKYIMHYMNLKQCIEKGMICTNIHRILTFKQTSWLKPYIDLNTQMRASAKNSFEKDFYKLMNNAVFGKTIENVEKRIDVKLCQHWDTLKTNTKCKYGLERYISRPNFHSVTIFSEDLAAVQLNKTSIFYNKPIYAGFTVLELSKTVMYSFHYDYMKPKYGKNVSLLYSDTDSFVYDIKTNNFYKDIEEDLSKFDTSDFPANNVYGLPQVNKKVVGLMKDENNGRIVREFVALRSKMYAYVLDVDNHGEGTQSTQVIKKNKGVNAATIRRLNFDKYYQCLDLENTFYGEFYNIISNKHNVYTQLQRKKILCGKDDKRFLLENGTETLAWGHYKIPTYGDN